MNWGLPPLHPFALEERGFLRRLPHRARALEVTKLPQEATASAPARGRAPFRPQVVEGGGARPLRIYSERAGEKGSTA